MTLDWRGQQVHDDDDDLTEDQLAILREIEARLPTGAANDRYILDEHGNPELCPSLFKWGRWMEKADRHVCHDMDEGEGAANIRVSTVFLGLDHNHMRGFPGAKGAPVLWETMVFGGPLDGTMRRYTSRDAAFKGHQELCQKVARAQAKPPESPSGPART